MRIWLGAKSGITHSGMGLMHFNDPDLKKTFFMIVLAGLAIRVICGFFFTFSYDLSFWYITGISTESLDSIYATKAFWYPPVAGYLMSLWTLVGNLIGIFPGTSFSELLGCYDSYTAFRSFIATPEYALFMKVPLFVFDLLNGILIFSMVKNEFGEKRAVSSFGLWFLCPLVIWASAFACQIDTISTFFAILSVMYLRNREYFFSGAMLSLGALTKLFPACLMFLLIAFVLLREHDAADKIKAVLSGLFGAVVAAVLSILPMVFSSEIRDVFGFLTGRLDGGSSGASSFFLLDFEFSHISEFMIQILVILAIVAFLYHRHSANNPLFEKDLFFVSMMLTFAVIFVFPCSLTYGVILIPFLLYCMNYKVRLLLFGYIAFSIINTVYGYCNFGLDLLFSISAYTDLLSLDTVIPLSESLRPIWVQVISIVRLLGIIPSVLIFAGVFGLDYKQGCLCCKDP